MAEREPENRLGVVEIGAREIYDEVVGLREDMRSVAEKGEELRADVDDHETRIRDLERWRYALPVAAVSGVVAAGVTVAKATGKA
ncbi:MULTISPECIES: hypothetical protein [Streptomyces]|uniref:hypothetical protein n=1 Tax=Streptomyces TaxID=1883 RepID=UPI002E12F46B|nr:hypothetical protein OG457_31235 [Streptomyces sp. NBC_01207]WTA17853.1 hypothetical protein OG365_07155 [Streptomyces sp. NBC_00853]